MLDLDLKAPLSINLMKKVGYYDSMGCIQLSIKLYNSYIN